MNKVLITGSEGDLGQSLSHHFSKKGFEVIGLDLADRSIHLKHYYSCDITDSVKLESTYEDILSTFETIDIVIHNAGIAHVEKFEEEDDERFFKLMDVNFNSVVRSTRFWLKKLRGNSNGKIINMASMAGIVAPTSMCGYSASKHALVGFTRSLQLEEELHDEPVFLGLVCPGFLKSEMINLGGERGFPKSMEHFLAEPDKVCKSIVAQIIAGEKEIIPDSLGKVMSTMTRISPKLLGFLNKKLAKKVF